jgi:DNA-binding CsgD family transcriptional regulator
MSTTEGLRPVERRVLRWADAGLGDAEIGRRFGRSERWTAQVRFLADLDRPLSAGTAAEAGAETGPDHRLRPLERRVLRWRAEGADHDELSTRFRRSPEFMARVEEYARYKLAAS